MPCKNQKFFSQFIIFFCHFLSIFSLLRTHRWLAPGTFCGTKSIEATRWHTYGYAVQKTKVVCVHSIIFPLISAISSQSSTGWGRIVDPHLRVIRASRASRLLASMHVLLSIAKNRNRLWKIDRFYLRFYLRFSVRFLLAAPMRAETPTNWQKSEKNCRTLMSAMLLSNSSYLLLISLS